MSLEHSLPTPPTRTLKQAISRYVPFDSRKQGHTDAEGYVEGAEAALKIIDYESATTLLSEALKLEPDNAHIYYLRGRARCNSVDGDEDAALADLKKAIELGEPNPAAYDYMARIYDGQKKPMLAIKALSEGIEKTGGDKVLYRNRATLHLEQRDRSGAMADYTRVLEIDPRDSYTYLLRGQLNESNKSYNKALEDYGKAARFARKKEKISNFELAYKARAILLSHLGRYQEAITDFSKVLARNTDDDEVLRLRGQAYASLGKYDKAIADYTRAIEVAPDFARATYEARSKAYEHIGRSALAAKDRAAARKLKQAPAERPLYEIK